MSDLTQIELTERMWYNYTRNLESVPGSAPDLLSRVRYTLKQDWSAQLIIGSFSGPALQLTFNSSRQALEFVLKYS